MHGIGAGFSFYKKRGYLKKKQKIRRKMNMKKILTITLVCAMVLGLFAGCGKAPATDATNPPAADPTKAP